MSLGRLESATRVLAKGLIVAPLATGSLATVPLSAGGVTVSSTIGCASTAGVGLPLTLTPIAALTATKLHGAGDVGV